MNIIVIGGGIGGLTLAIALAKVGVEAQVYERASELREVGAGIGVMPNALRALDVVGLGDTIRSRARGNLQNRLLHSSGRTLVAIPTNDPALSADAVTVMHRAELLDLLRQHVEPERLRLGYECTGIEQDATGVLAHFANGATARADALIGADGLRSVVRKHLFDDVPLRYAGYTAWRSVVTTELGGSSVSETWGRGRRFGIVPLNGGRVYWFATDNAPEGRRDPAGKTKAELARLFRGWHKPVEALIDAADEDSILRNDIYDIDPLPRWSVGRMTLLGDAAHPMTPNLGQGGCQAIEDAVILAACLKKNSNVEEGLREYERRRIPRTRRIVLAARRLGAIGQIENRALCWLRDTATRLTPKELAARQMRSLLEVDLMAANARK